MMSAIASRVSARYLARTRAATLASVVTRYRIAREDVAYGKGDIIVKKGLSGNKRVLVKSKKRNIKNGSPGFDGVIVDSDDPTDVAGEQIWGYSYDVLENLGRAPANILEQIEQSRGGFKSREKALVDRMRKYYEKATGKKPFKVGVYDDLVRGWFQNSKDDRNRPCSVFIYDVNGLLAGEPSKGKVSVGRDAYEVTVRSPRDFAKVVEEMEAKFGETGLASPEERERQPGEEASIERQREENDRRYKYREQLDANLRKYFKKAIGVKAPVAYMSSEHGATFSWRGVSLHVDDAEALLANKRTTGRMEASWDLKYPITIASPKDFLEEFEKGAALLEPDENGRVNPKERYQNRR